MSRIFLGLVAVSLIAGQTAFAGGQKGNFALSLQGGSFWDSKNELFDNPFLQVNFGLEYYFLDQIALGSLFSFSQTNFSKSGYCPLCLGCPCPIYQYTDQLYQTGFYLRFLEATRSPVKMFILGGPTINHVRRKENGGVYPAGSDGIDSPDNPLGIKFGTGAFLKLNSRLALNLTLAMDTKPEVFFSTLGGLSFSFGPPVRKSSAMDDF